MTATDSPVEGAQGYFEAIESMFIRLRGAPLLLSPTDWQMAQEWFEAGIPLDLVRGALESVFERRRERGARGRVQSLRYCRDAVWKAWEEVCELQAAGGRQPAVTLDLGSRLVSLAAALPPGMVDRDSWQTRIRGLSGSSDEVERALAELDSELLAAVEHSLSAADRERLATRVETTLSGLRNRLPEAEIESARYRISRAALRDAAHLPLLSLFSAEAAAGESQSDAGSSEEVSRSL